MSVPSYSSEWLPLFPYDEPRKEQAEAIDDIIHSFKNGKRFVVADLPTGIGKSAIGATIARWAYEHLKLPANGSVKKGGTFITTQKVLQDQYMKDFAKDGMKSIKSSTNYKCKFESRESCSSAGKINRLGGPAMAKWRKACKGLNCHYRAKKAEWIESPMSVTSFAYFLTDTAYNKTMPRKQILVIDEAHNIEQQLMSFVEVTINEAFVKNELGMKMPDFKNVGERFRKWIFNDYFKALSTEYLRKEKMVAEIQNVAKNHNAAKDIISKFEALKTNYDKLARLRMSYDANPENWVEYIEKNTFRGRTNTIVKFKPVDVAEFCDQYLYSRGQYILCMSATIINAEGFCNNAGLKYQMQTGQVKSIEKGSPFPAKNRKILYLPVGSMAKAEIDRTLPRMAAQVQELLEMHDGEKGIIHCHTYKIASYLMEHVKSDRLITHSASDREQVLKEHCESKNATVLISPSMAEGIDLKDDLSRFQIICKIPFPYMGDKQVKKKMSIDKTWYSYETAKVLIQSTGRSVRSLEDHATTYVLDKSWWSFYSRNWSLFPKWFKEAYHDLSDSV